MKRLTHYLTILVPTLVISAGAADAATADMTISTDKACYAPGAKVCFKTSNVPQGARVRYRHGADVIGDVAIKSASWVWTPPTDDFKGYMAEVYLPGDCIIATIAVDVSSTWTRFPRYGFVDTFDKTKLAEGVIDGEMAYLNRCHINGIQFYDWHYKHHQPLGEEAGKLLEQYTDIGNREIYADVVRRYIAAQHAYGMKAMFYNLAFGALDDGLADGVKEQWCAYRDVNRQQQDYHGLPQGWKSSIYLVDPANPGWQQYLADRNEDVYSAFDFDGFHIDQLGNRGQLFDYAGNSIYLPSGYRSFINAMKQRHPDKLLVMNSVGSYGADEITGTGKVEFAYNELWGDEDRFTCFHDVIRANDAFSGNTLRTVFAAYMNYDYAGEHTGFMNTPGVLLTDAVIMALGGDHLELGDHMLCREYFPSTALVMDDHLKAAMINYYDFMTAYQNLLRDGTTADEFVPTMSYDGDADVTISAWPPRLGHVTAYARTHGDKKVYHLINFINADNLCWRDLQCTRQAPVELTDVPVKVKVDGDVSRIWAASPDYKGGAVQPLEFTVAGGEASFTMPGLNYWTMIVIE